MPTILTKKSLLDQLYKSQERDLKQIKKMEDFLKRTDEIMYWRQTVKKTDLLNVSNNFSDPILKIVKPVCKKVLKVLKSFSNHWNIPKPKIP